MFRPSFRIVVLCISGLFVVARPAALVAAPPTRPVLIGYSAVWRDASVPAADFDYTAYTHIARAFVRPSADGAVVLPDGYFNPAMEQLARQHGVKLLLSLGGGGASNADWLAMASRAGPRNTFLDHLGRLMKEHQYDGVDIDWEPPDPTQADGEAYGQLLRALRGRFPTAILTTALPADRYQTRFIPWETVIACVDYVNVMAYDFSGPWSGIAGHASNLYPAGDYTPAAGHSVDEGMRNLIDNAHVPPAKLVLGLNLWAYRFRVDQIGGSFTKNAADASDVLSYAQTLGLVQTGVHQDLWDAKAKMNYVRRATGGSVVAMESPESVRRKCEYAQALGCAGMMIWNINADACGTQTPLTDAIVQTYGGPRHTLSRASLETQINEMVDALKRPAGAGRPAPEVAAVTPVVPPGLSKLTVEQLEALRARLQYATALADDLRWQTRSPPRR